MRAKKSAAGAALEDYHQRRMEECTEELRIFSTSTVSKILSSLSRRRSLLFVTGATN
jgi:hypothetical protein